VYGALSADRLRAELGRVLAEPTAFAVVAELRRLGAPALLGSGASALRERDATLGRADARTRGMTLSSATRESLAILALGAGGGPAAVNGIGLRLGLPAERLAALRRARTDAPALLGRLARAGDRSEAYRTLAAAPELSAGWALLAAAWDRAAGRRAMRSARRSAGFLSRHLRQWRHMRPLIDGDDLRALHVTPGPRFGVLLRQSRAAQVGGRFRTRAGALRWLRRALPTRSRPPSQADRKGKRGSV
jgi:tRNA nucleotidyltransferase/poly(A) polymerase